MSLTDTEPNSEGRCPTCGADLGISGTCYVCKLADHPFELAPFIQKERKEPFQTAIERRNRRVQRGHIDK